MSKNPKQPGAEAGGKIDPDPVSIGLIIIGAAASVASIADYVHGRIDKWKEKKQKKKTARLRRHILILRSELGGIQESAGYIFKLALQQNPKADFSLGEAELLFNLGELEEFMAAYEKVLKHVRNAQEETLSIIYAIHDIDEEVLEFSSPRLKEATREMNELLRKQPPLTDALPRIQNYVEAVMKELAILEEMLKTLEE
jgi:hypothetical protein